MKFFITRWFVGCVVVGMSGFFLSSNLLLGAEEEETVRAKPKTVKHDGNIDYNDADESAPESITTTEQTTKINSKTFRPPTGMVFVQFPVITPATHVDIWISPDALSPGKTHDTDQRIKIFCTLRATAGQFPYAGEGNLGAPGDSPMPHWSAKIGNMKFDLIIHDGFAGDGVGAEKVDGPAIPERQEESRGAFTVANKNDTDSDEAADNGDNAIPSEKDMIKLVIKKVTDVAIDGTIDLSITGDGTKVKLWKAETKAGGLESTRQWNIAGTNWPVTIWVEGMQESDSVRDIEVVIKHNNQTILDKAKLTFVWATQTAVEHDRKTAAQLLAAAAWKNMTIIPKIFFMGDDPIIDGTGLLPINAATGVLNCIVFKYKLEPTGLWVEGVRWDLTRQLDGKCWEGTKGQDGKITWSVAISESWPADDESPNDDRGITDESRSPNTDHEMFGMDSPGYPKDTADFDIGLMRYNFKEFVRVRLDGVKPSNNGTNGARCSLKYKWHVRHRFVKDVGTGKFKRDSGDAPESNTNDIGPDHITIGDPA